MNALLNDPNFAPLNRGMARTTITELGVDNVGEYLCVANNIFKLANKRRMSDVGMVYGHHKSGHVINIIKDELTTKVKLYIGIQVNTRDNTQFHIDNSVYDFHVGETVLTQVDLRARHITTLLLNKKDR